MAPLDRRHRNREVLNMLLEKASVQGYLTTDDLLEVSPDVGEDAERLSVIMLALRHRGVDVVDPEVLEAPPAEFLDHSGIGSLDGTGSGHKRLHQRRFGGDVSQGNVACPAAESG